MGLKIGIFCDAFSPENKAVAVRMLHLAEAFSKKDFEVTVQTSTRKSAGNVRINVQQNILNAPSNEGSNLKRLSGEFLLGIEMFGRILLSRYDLLIITSPPFFASCLGSFAARLRGMPYVFDVRDEYPEVFMTAAIVKEKSIIGKVLLWLERSVYKNAFVVCTVTEGICKRIDAKMKQENKAILLRNGFDSQLFKPSAQKEEIFTIVFHGNIGKFQDPELILSLAAKAEKANLPVQFKIIGWGNNDTSLKEHIPSNVTYLGMLNYEKIPQVISKAHLGISFRSNDIISKNSFPVKLYEYIGVGIPVIVTPRSEAGDFVEANGIGYQFDSEELDSIFDKINILVSDHGELQKLSDNITPIRQSFSRHAVSDKFVELIKVRLQSISKL